MSTRLSKILRSALILAVLTCAASPSPGATVETGRYGGFLSPTRLALAKSGDIYVTDHRRGLVAVLDSTGVRIGTIQGLGAPLGVALFEPPQEGSGSPDGPSNPSKRKNIPIYRQTPDAESGTSSYSGLVSRDQLLVSPTQPLQESETEVFLFVGDEADGSVRVFADGEPAGFLGQGGGEFQQPNSIATLHDAAGALRIYVVDSKANQVKVYDDQYALMFTFGVQGDALGEFDFPSDIAIDRVRSKLYVSDFMNERIGIFDLDGGPLGTIRAPRNDQGDPIFLRPAGLGIDPYGLLYVVDNGLSCVAIIDDQGNLYDAIGYTNGQYWTNELVLPVDAVSDGVRVLVTSNRQSQVVVFEVQP